MNIYTLNTPLLLNRLNSSLYGQTHYPKNVTTVLLSALLLMAASGLAQSTVQEKLLYESLSSAVNDESNELVAVQWYAGNLTGDEAEEFTAYYTTNYHSRSYTFSFGYVAVFEITPDTAIMIDAILVEEEDYRIITCQVDSIADQAIHATLTYQLHGYDSIERYHHQFRVVNREIVGMKTANTLQKIQDGEALNILDYYILYKRGSTPYRASPLFEMELTPSQYREVVIDENNAYLLIDDAHGTGVGTTRIAMTYFLDANDSPVFAVSSYVENAGMYYNADYPFNLYRFEDSAWADCTDELLPEITLQDFATTNTWESILEKDTAEEIDLYYEGIRYALRFKLPQFGTTITIRPSHTEAPVWYEVWDLLNYKALELNWNKELGEFEIGDKIGK